MRTSTATRNQDGTVTVLLRATGPKRSPEVTAVFPCDPADRGGDMMTCYAHVGQHSGCSLQWYRTTRPATKEEAAPLLAELRSIGYTKLRVVQRISDEMHEVRRCTAWS